MKGTGRILVPEASALCLAPIRTRRGPGQSLSPITSQPIIVREGRPRRKRCMLLQWPAEHAHSIHMLCVTVLCTLVSVCTFSFVCVCGGGGWWMCDAVHFSVHIYYNHTYIMSDSKHRRSCVCLYVSFQLVLICMNKITWHQMQKSTLIYSFFQMRKPCHYHSSLPVFHSGCKVRLTRTRDFSVGGFCHQDDPLCPLPRCCSALKNKKKKHFLTDARLKQ